MPFVETSTLREIERLPGWRGRFFHSRQMTFAHYAFDKGAIREHHHAEEEVYEVIEGELEIAVDGETRIIRPGLIEIAPANAKHSVKALTDGRAIIIDHPAQPKLG